MSTSHQSFLLKSVFCNAKSAQFGQSLIELIIAIAVASAVMPALFYGFYISTNSKANEGQTLAASALLKEGVEAVRSVRQANWTNIATDGSFHPTVVAGSWLLVSGSETVNQLTRVITIADTQRDGNGNIVSSGTVDPSTKKITTTVSWSKPYANSVSSTIYLTRYLNNQTILQPSPNQFTTYSSISNVSVATNSASLTPPGSSGDWCAATPKIDNNLDLNGTNDATAISAIPGEAFVGLASGTSNLDFTNVSISNPPAGQQTVNFDNINSGAALNGTYAGINWGTNIWKVLAAVNADPTNAISFNAASQTSATFSFATAAIVNSVGVFNNDTVSSTVTLSCTGNPNAQITVNKKTIATLTTNWTHTCTTVTMQTTDNLKTALDNLVYTTPGGPVVPLPVQNGTYNSNLITNDIFGESGFAYLATTNNSKEIQILDVNNGTGTVTADGTVNLTGSNDAVSVFAISNTTYGGEFGLTISGSSLFTFDLKTKSGTKTPLATYALPSTGARVYAVNIGTKTYAFVAVNGSTSQLEIVNVTNPAAPVFVSRLKVSNQGGTGIFVSSDGLRVYLTTTYLSGQPDFFIIDTSTIATPKLANATSSYTTAGMNPKNVVMVGAKNRAIIVGSGGTYQYEVLNLNNESSITRCSGAAFTGSTVYDVAPVVDSSNNNYAYLVTSDPLAEFQIVEGGSGSIYPASGSYESVTFDAGANVAFNRVQATFNQPAGTNIAFQAAVAQAVSNSCNGVTFAYQSLINVATSSSGITTTLNGAIPYPLNQGRCFRYKATLTPSSNLLTTPTLQAVTTSYSP